MRAAVDADVFLQLTANLAAFVVDVDYDGVAVLVGIVAVVGDIHGVVIVAVAEFVRWCDVNMQLNVAVVPHHAFAPADAVAQNVGSDYAATHHAMDVIVVNGRVSYNRATKFVVVLGIHHEDTVVGADDNLTLLADDHAVVAAVAVFVGIAVPAYNVGCRDALALVVVAVIQYCIHPWRSVRQNYRWAAALSNHLRGGFLNAAADAL